MLAETFKNSSHFFKLIFILFAILVSFLFFMVLSLIIAIPLFGIDLGNLASMLDLNNQENIGLMKFLQSMYSIGLFISPPLIAAFFFGGKIGAYLQINKLPGALSVILPISILIFGIPIVNFLVKANESMQLPDFMGGIEQWFRKLENDAKVATQSFLVMDSFGAYLINLFVLAIIPAVGEEFLFRGILQRLLHEWTKRIHIAIWLSAFIFSAIHFQFYGIVPRMVLGAFFGYLFFWSQNLWIPIIAHFFNNAFAITIAYRSGHFSDKIENIGTEGIAKFAIFFSAAIVIALIALLVKYEKKKIQTLKITSNNTSEYDQNT